MDILGRAKDIVYAEQMDLLAAKAKTVWEPAQDIIDGLSNYELLELISRALDRAIDDHPTK